MRSDLEQELLRHAGALRSLAAALVGDGDADDLVQETAVAALQSPPARPGPLGGWLAGVVRHLASRRRRSERRRRERERAVARIDAVPADRGAEDRDTLRALTDAILALPEPYRGTLLERYLRDRPLAAIAADGGIPVETVKSRHQRAVAMLRTHFARRRGRDWRAALGTTFGLREGAATSAVTTPATTVPGALTVTTSTKGLLCGAIAALALLAVLRWRGDDAAADPPRTVATVPAVAASADRSLPRAGEQDAGAAPPAREPVPIAAAGVVVRGRCVDGETRPLAACAVQVSARSDVAVLGATTTAGDGVFEIVLPADAAADAASLRVQLAAHRPARRPLAGLVAGRIADLGDVRLEAVREVRLRTVDTGGRPVPRVFVQLGGDTARTDETGTATLLARAGTSQVRTVPPALLESANVPAAEGTFEGPFELTIPVGPPVESIDGVVVDDRGLPLDAAWIRATADEVVLGGAWTGTNGRFAIGRLPGQTMGPITLRVHAPSCEPAAIGPLSWETHDLRVTMLASGTVALRVVRTDGTPVDRFEAWIHPVGGPAGMHEEGARAAGRFPGGLATIAGVSRGRAHASVVPADPSLGARLFVDCTVGTGGPAVEIVLPDVVERTLRVEQEGGEPVHGAAFELLAPVFGREPAMHSWSGPFDGANPETFVGSMQPGAPPALLVQQGVTGANGEAVLRGPAGEALRLRIRSTTALLVAADLAQHEPLVVTLPASGRVRGRVADPEIARRVRRLLAPAVPPGRGSLLVSLRASTAVAGDARRSMASRLADDGTFEFANVPAGTWIVQATLQVLPLMRRVELGTLTVRGGETTEHDLDLAALAPSELRATILVDEEPAAGSQLLLIGRSGFGDVATPERRVDDDGVFDACALPGSYRARLALDPGGGFGSLELAERLVVPPGTTLTPTLHFVSGRARLRVLDGAGHPVIGVRLEVTGPQGSVGTARATGADGTTDVRCAPGVYTLFAWRSDLQTREARDAFGKAHARDELAAARFEVGRIELGASQTVERELRLPVGWQR